MRAKKILILSCSGGYGHMAATNTIKKLLGDTCPIKVVYPINELRIYGVPSGEAFYNYVISYWANLMNFLVRSFVFPIFQQREEKMTQLIEKHIRDYQPDIVISVIPFVNFPASEAARRQGIPFLLVTTDNDLFHWVNALEKCEPNSFKVTIGNDLPTSKQLLLNKRIKPTDIETIGLPLRPDFLHTKSKEQLRKEYAIPTNKHVVLIMMGGIGSQLTYKYVKMIAKSPLNAHFLVCTGKNKRLARRLKKVKPIHSNSIDIIPFTEKVDELFGLSDLLITKPGPGTINEAIALKLPILIDRTTIPLMWEEVNVEMVLARKIGTCIHKLEEAPELIQKYLHDKEVGAGVAEAYENIPKNQFADRIGTIIEELCQVQIPGEVAMTSRIYSPNSL